MSVSDRTWPVRLLWIDPDVKAGMATGWPPTIGTATSSGGVLTFTFSQLVRG